MALGFQFTNKKGEVCIVISARLGEQIYEKRHQKTNLSSPRCWVQLSLFIGPGESNVGRW